MEAFKALDRDQSQTIDPKNLVIAFSTLGEEKKMDQNMARKIINLVAADKKDSLNYEEFIKLMTMEPEIDDKESDNSEDEKQPLNFES